MALLAVDVGRARLLGQDASRQRWEGHGGDRLSFSSKLVRYGTQLQGDKFGLSFLFYF